MGEIEAPDQVLVVLDPVGVVDIVVENKAQWIADAGFHHTPKLDLRKRAVAREGNILDREFFAFLNLEDEIDPAVVAPLALDRLRHDLRVEIAVGSIEIENAHDIALDEFARHWPVGFGLHLPFESGVFDLSVAFESD